MIRISGSHVDRTSGGETAHVALIPLLLISSASSLFRGASFFLLVANRSIRFADSVVSQHLIAGLFFGHLVPLFRQVTRRVFVSSQCDDGLVIASIKLASHEKGGGAMAGNGECTKMGRTDRMDPD